ncbi:MAG TPA: rhomboid family intramembrane serine protease [Anaerolineae bacterium]|nr:rhomboid family intramembrane serine protease [Anaerolineae bacterium]
MKRFTPAKMAARVSEVRYWFWVSTFKSPWTWSILACIGVVGLLQVTSGFGRSSDPDRSVITLAGIVKDNIRQGETWRLLTGTLLHANLMHFLFNFLALLGLGKLIEVIANRAYVPLVFITAALVGSLFSLWLLPTQTSVGASGGIMGLIGFLAVLSYFHRNLLPRAFLKSLLISIIYVFVAGLVAFNAIDNPAHLGGLLAGAASGILLARNKQNQIPLPTPRAISLLGVLAMAGVAAVVALCAQRLIAG